jgi:hypothetical protein
MDKERACDTAGEKKTALYALPSQVSYLTLYAHKVQANQRRLELIEGNPTVLVGVEVAEDGHQLCGLCGLVSEAGVCQATTRNAHIRQTGCFAVCRVCGTIFRGRGATNTSEA